MKLLHCEWKLTDPLVSPTVLRTMCRSTMQVGIQYTTIILGLLTRSQIPKFDGYHQRAQPDVLSKHIAEIEAFSRVCCFIAS